MYTEYFGLADSPFSISPDPHYLYLSDNHREALAHLIYGVGDQGGFVVLTGEVGTGKTTICRSLLLQVPDNVDVAFIINPKQSINQLLQSIFSELSVPVEQGMTSKDMIDRLNEYLLLAHANGRNTVLIIDEAQNLSAEILEQLRLLTNLETNEKKLLQLVLLGQPELNDMLAKPELRQLAQRVTARYHLPPLNKAEVNAYIQHRLSVARCHTEIFSPAAIKTVYKLSGGIPRLINLICDRAMLGVYSLNGSVATPSIVKKASKEVFANHKARKAFPWSIVLASVFALAVVFSTYFISQSGDLTPDSNTASEAAFDSLPANASYQEEVSNLLSSWQLEGLSHRFAHFDCSGFTGDQVYCHRLSGRLPVLSLIEQPAIIEYQKSDGSFAYLVLQGVTDRHVTVVADNQLYQFEKQWLDALSVTGLLYFSRVPADLALPIQPGVQGREVLWLTSMLNSLNEDEGAGEMVKSYHPQTMSERSKIHHLYSYRLDTLPAELSYYNEPLQARVKSLQKQYGLPETAVVDRRFVSQLLAQLNTSDPLLRSPKNGGS